MYSCNNICLKDIPKNKKKKDKTPCLTKKSAP